MADMIKKAALYLPALIFLAFLLPPESRLTILPSKGERSFRVEAYVDYLDTTRGSLGTFTTLSDSLLVFEYTLHPVNNNSASKPISGFTMMFDKYARGQFLDVSSYDYLDIDISLKEGTSFILYFKTFEHFTDTTKWMTQRYSEEEVTVLPRTARYRLKFREFSTPTWWKSLIGPRFLTLPKTPDYTKLMALDFQNTPGGPLEVPERMEIRRIEFVRDRRALVIIALCGSGLWIIIVSLILLVRRKKRNMATGMGKPARHVTLVNHSDEQLQRLVEFIGSNYQSPELSAEVLGRETGIGLPRISALLQQKYSMNFKQYLNDIRITEAKRLLRESDRTIAEIAFAVGYNSIPHFNRVFRQHTETTPTDFRESGKQIRDS
jgi:AraC-like DNA-binding protein